MFHNSILKYVLYCRNTSITKFSTHNLRKGHGDQILPKRVGVKQESDNWKKNSYWIEKNLRFCFGSSVLNENNNQ